MKRIVVLSTLIALLAVSFAVSAQQPQGAAAQAEAPKVIEVDVTAIWKIPAKYKGYAEPVPERLKNNIKLAYAESK